MPSFRWKVTVETNPGKDDASGTSARTASTCAPTDLCVDKQAAAFTPQEKNMENYFADNISFFAFVRELPPPLR